MKIIVLILVLSCFSIAPSVGQNIVLNEIMSSNTTTLTDEDDDYSDWIELYNGSAEILSLIGWGLSDRSDDSFKWKFPEVSLHPDQHLLIFASGKDRSYQIPFWETIITQGDVWRYYPGTGEPSTDWLSLSFDDSGWYSGPSGFGFNDGDDATILPSPLMSVYIRKKFDIENSADILTVLLDIDFDDAFVAYLNGQEIARSNIGTPGIRPAYNQGADNYNHEAKMYTGGIPDRFEIKNWADIIVNGENVLAIQAHNHTLNSSDMSCIPFLSLALSVLPQNPSGSPEILKFPHTHLHTNFKISSQGETISLTMPHGALADSVYVPVMQTDYSYGRQPDGNPAWLIFNTPTPGSVNSGVGLPGYVKSPEFSTSGGFYPTAFELLIQSPDAGSQIYYTSDGSIPDKGSDLYQTPIQIDSGTVIRARAYQDGLYPSPTITNTYFIDTAHDLPVFSISTTPANLWSADSGIYVLGNDYQSGAPHFGANFWEDWEKPAHIEFYETDKSLAFSIDGGIKIHGGWSRDRPQKSLAVFARGRYGYSEIDYPLFPELPFEKYESFILRNAANDWDRTMFADGMIHNLSFPLDLESQAYRPTVVYLNGAYFGIFNLREKLNEAYLEQHANIDPDKVDILEFDGQVVEGDASHYQNMLEFISTHDMTLPENYGIVKSMMDIDNFIDYQAFEIYIDNRDWPGNNIKFWRSHSEEGKWRWLLYDTEWGFGLNAYGSGGNTLVYNYNTLEFATSPTQTPNHHGNPPWSTFLLRNLLVNNEFKNEFINRLADQINSIFLPDKALTLIDSIYQLIENEMPRHYEKWHNGVWWSPDILWWSGFNDWYGYIDILREFARNRPPYMMVHIIQKFGLSGVCRVSLNTEPAGAGLVKINQLKPDQLPWNGYYFNDVPVPVSAVAKSGYKFKGWSGDIVSGERELTLNLNGTLNLTAVFEKDASAGAAIVINEINYNSADDFNPEDWIELYCQSEEPVDISGWLIQDDQDEHQFIIPENTELTAGGYLVLCRDMNLFQPLYPNVKNVMGDLDFGLGGKGDMVRLYNSDLILVDSVKFTDKYPWPVAADGEGATLELLNPARDNALPENWAASSGHGTPGSVNSRYTAIHENEKVILPGTCNLYQNYPNPFNPKTIIPYSVWVNNFSPQLVDLSIYNLLGQKVATLVSEKQAVGSYTVEWDGSGFASGVYLYQLTTDQGFTQTKKLVLLK